MDWYARYFKVRNQDGEEIVIDRYDNTRNYKRMGRAFCNFTKMNGLLFIKHITLTQAKESYKPNILHPFFMALRKRYGRIAYIWTAEIQEERREKYGDVVLHWHVVVAFEPDVHFGKEDILKIQSYWKYGNVDIKPVKKLNLGYIMKYIQKSLDTPLIEYQGLKVRKISMSRIPQLYRHCKEKMLQCLDWFKFHLDDIGKFFKVDKKGIYYEFPDYWGVLRKDYAVMLNRWVIVDWFDGAEPF